MKSPITTHVLDTSLGRPAAGVGARLEIQEADGSFRTIGHGTTNADGRIADLLEPGRLDPGVYRLIFEVDAYFAATDRKAFYPHVPIVFRIEAPEEHYHVPLLLSPFGYSTYRGS